VAQVSFANVEKVYPDGTHAVRDLNLMVSDGQLLVLVGPSGCGKTTALRMVAGLEDISAGTIRIGDRVVNGLDPRARDIAMVFQNYALYPHMTVYNNIAFPLRLQRVARSTRDEKVRAVARTLGLEAHLDRKPPQLSGGQRQRVAMGRAIIREPSVFLMDEPLSNLDAKLRVQMRAEISRLQRQLGVTTVYVTHDQVEAMTIGDRVAVMRKSRLQQVADPQTIYDRPANLFVAGFIGSPPMNLLEGEVASGAAGQLQITIAGAPIDIDPAEQAAHPGLASRHGTIVVVGVRPERLQAASDQPETRRLHGSVTLCEALGSDSLIHVLLPQSAPLSPELFRLAHDVDEAVEAEDLRTSEQPATVIARLDPRTAVRVDEQIEIGIAPGSLRFFDLDDGGAIAAASG
jgi:multiple sugar transport system ATP-binding protein